MGSGRSFESSAPFHSKIAETGHKNDTFEKAIYGRCDAMGELRRQVRATRLSILSLAEDTMGVPVLMRIAMD